MFFDYKLPSLVERHVFTMPNRIVVSAWLGHIPFAKWLVGVHQPSIAVELGVHNGASLCAMAEAASDLGHSGIFYGVDHWIGDAHAGSHTVEVYWNLKAYLMTRPLEAVKLMRMNFDEALPYFENESVDLLHIDGLHTYDAVKQDFETWMPKLSRRGIIIFHDIRVIDNDFGVWKLWDEISRIYPSFDFDHSHGLGVIYVGSEPMPLWMEQFFGSRTTDSGQSLRDYFARLGGAIITEQAYGACVSEVSALRRDLDASRHQASQLHLKDCASTQAIAAIDLIVSINESKIQSLIENNFLIKEELIVAQQSKLQLDILKSELDAMKAICQSREQELDIVRADRDAIIAERNSILSDNDSSISACQVLEGEQDTGQLDKERADTALAPS